jgi:hypothetical protein
MGIKSGSHLIKHNSVSKIFRSIMDVLFSKAIFNMGQESPYNHIPGIDTKELYAAIRANDAERLAQLCKGARLTTFFDKAREKHRLTEAIRHSAGIPVLQVLIDSGVDPLELPKRGYQTPLGEAQRLNRIDCFKYLLELGVDPNAELDDHRITLMGGSDPPPVPMQLDMLKLLVEHGVDINFQFTLFGDKDKLFTALDFATSDEVKEYLRSVGGKTAAELSGQDPSRLRSLDDKHLDEVRVYVEGVFGTSEERSFRKIVTASPGISVHVIKPKSPQGFLTLFTTGMSAKPMKVPPELAEHAFAELYMQLPGDWDFQSSDPRYSWPIQLLLDLAAYPAENDAYFAVPVTTIANGEPAKPLGPNVKFTASALIADEGFQRSDGKTVHLFCVMPIYAEEAEMARRFIPDFLNALDASGTSRILSLNRPNFAK